MYRLTIILLTAVQGCINLCGLLGFFVQMEDTLDDIELLQLLFANLSYFLSAFKIIICVYNANKIQDLLEVTRINFITSAQCTKHVHILLKYRDMSIKITNCLSVSFAVVLLGWWICPLIFNRFVLKSNDEIVRYENVVNYRFPLTIAVYNDYFWIFYLMEVALGVFLAYAILITDCLLISISCVLIAHYEIHALAFENIGHEKQICIGKYIFLGIPNGAKNVFVVFSTLLVLSVNVYVLIYCGHL